MTFQIAVHGRDISFPCEDNESVLEAAQRAGYEIPYSCRKGVCATCEGRLVAGEAAVTGTGVVRGDRDNVTLCQTRPRSDLVIAPKRIERYDPLARKTVLATVFRISRPAPDVTIAHLRFPAGIKVKFRAGQYLQVLMDDGQRRSFSMANSPAEKDGVQLHIRRVPGGRFSDSVASALKPGDKVRLELPFGDFFLREESDKPILFVATGTGFAPIKSIAEDALKRGCRRHMRLYWGARSESDLYLSELPRRWVDEYSNFSFVPVLSEPADGWSGRRGLVHQAVLEDFSSLAGHQVYACGNPLMTDACRKEFVARANLPADEIFCDAFVVGG
jgi:CDP-4-dehydro-6-deoxyglucose reductase/3-phenylpropionate/trans-cinnamate dioxygenase ferredoxin reductase subunit